jgi:hypothetical protein
MSAGIFTSKRVSTTFTFSGDGSWSIPGNWRDGLKPPSFLPVGFSILIDPQPGGICNLDSIQHIATGAGFDIHSGAMLFIEQALYLH